MGLLKGKVALVTGAGGGLGRAYALLFSKEGAKVVVNDLGVDRHGSESGEKMADLVVNEIKAAGGEAVANYGSVSNPEDAQAMVDQAIDAFGKIDIVINNAGILRDKTLVKLTKDMWDPVIDVHLTGTYLVTRAAVLAMKNNGGRIINTSSIAGLKGNFGQTNYGAAKAGIAGLTRVVAMETQRNGITVNAIAPVAKTRMTTEIDMVPDSFEPEDIAPLVCWLVSDEAASVTGRVFGAHGSHFFEYLTETTPGIDLDETRWTPALVGERFDEITQKKKAAGATSGAGNPKVRALFENLPSTYRADKAGDWEANLVFNIEDDNTYSLLVAGGKATFQEGAASPAKAKVTFDAAQTILDMAAGKLAAPDAFMKSKIKTDNMGALMKFGQFFDLEAAAGDSEDGPRKPKGDGVNFGCVGKKFRAHAVFVEPDQITNYADATDDPRDAYSGDDAIAPPIFAVKPLFGVMTQAIMDPELNADFLRLLHGEQEMIFDRPLKAWDLVTPRAAVSQIEAKSSGTLINVAQSLLVDGQSVIDVNSGVFIRSAEPSTGSKKPKAETATPTILFEERQTVAADQPKRYADASGDHNPIHVDEDTAKRAGLPSVILHGLCTMAFASRAIVNGVCDGDVARLARIKVRFSKPVLPGQTLTTRVWSRGNDGEYGFDVQNDAGETVISGGEADVN